MALQLEKTSYEGYTIEYWRVNPVATYDVVNQILRTSVIPYVNATTRASEKRLIFNDDTFISSIEQVTLSGADAVTAIQSNDFRDSVYTYLKTLDFFSGALDV